MEEIKLSENQNQNQKENELQQEKDYYEDPTHVKPKSPDDNDDEQVLKFMDSLDSYLSLVHSLSSTLRQGWFDLASARYSMGASRVNGVLLDLKEHSAATYLEVGTVEEPHFTLCKWASANADESKEVKDGDSGLAQTSNVHQRRKDMSEPAEAETYSSSVDGTTANTADQVQKERMKSVAVFGTLVSPKLRSSQSSFETALETLVEIANVRASLLSSFDQVHKQIVHVDGVKN